VLQLYFNECIFIVNQAFKKLDEEEEEEEKGKHTITKPYNDGDESEEIEQKNTSRWSKHRSIVIRENIYKTNE
jgi:hypothetical protein